MDRYEIALGKKPEPKPVTLIRPTEATVAMAQSLARPPAYFPRHNVTTGTIRFDPEYLMSTASHWNSPVPPQETVWSMSGHWSCPVCDEEALQEKQEKPKPSAEEKNIYNKMSYKKYQKNLPKFLR